ncbi:MAG: efflux RND transporter periplasmic adaptor subunit [Vicinamibacterales bacterium]
MTTIHQLPGRRIFAIYAALGLCTALAACGGQGAPAGGGPGGPGGGGPPAMGVEVVTLVEKPVERTSEFIATLKSRQSTTIQPQVEGFLTRIAVKSGDRVARGAVLFEIDAAPQQASLSSLQSMKAMRDAELQYARQQVQRTKTLLEAGAVAQRDLEQAETALRTSEAQLKSLEDQIRSSQSELAYYRVTSPTAGVIGDVPVRVGDRLTKGTMLTTVDDNAQLEVYVNVPVQQAPDLKVGVPVRIMDDKGGVLATNRITYVSPTVDDATQTVLAKAQLSEGRGTFRADQFVRVRLVWNSAPGLTIPVTAVTRINGQYFAFVAEANGPMTVAKQKSVQLGEIIGNDYVLQSGLKPGETLIVSGLQKIGDGAPVQVGPPAAAPQKAQ